ncbi:hypothetical protein Ahy_Scaffold6g108000 [Arachis hypogaea]|uniref:Uncharacterized protein n=1 Tax=Arachis hypogaea TaxID=3818 RepID=A0A444WP43_ARAHY|nr:hypothetical protein Ahy_Scaffold6g108000 [Arachis hypogaea]
MNGKENRKAAIGDLGKMSPSSSCYQWKVSEVLLVMLLSGICFVWPSVISTGPGNYPLNESYKAADGYAFQLHLLTVNNGVGCSWKIFRRNLQHCSSNAEMVTTCYLEG